jgi:tryptophan-rich sensory protein
LLCLAVGVVGSLATRPEIPVWYAALAKPWWTPPPVVFPIAWTFSRFDGYQSLAAVGSDPPSPARSSAIIWFWIQLLLNAAWSPVFFGWHGTRTALVIIALLIAIAMTIMSASRADKTAAWLLAPYLIWVAYATTLNAGVVAMN